MSIDEVNHLIARWERLARRARDPYRRRLAGRVLRTLNKRLLADRAGPATPTSTDRPCPTRTGPQ
jgi:hypothetical protein